jgi:type II secretory pathway component GspD/PulD (secretin)
MKYILYIIKSYLYLLFASLLMAKTTPELVNVHIALEDEPYLAFKKYSLIMEFDNGDYEYIINEKFAPPGLILEFKNVRWSKGDFVKKSSDRPLYQFGIKVPKNVNLKEKRKRLELKLDFTRMPEYFVRFEAPQNKKDNYKLIISWQEKKKKSPSNYFAPNNRLPETIISLDFQSTKLSNAVRMLASKDNLNLIMSDDVKGEVTVSLKEVSLETALDAILHVNNYEWFLQDNIIVVQPMEKRQVMSGELTTRMFRLDYITGRVALEAVSEVLTPKGKVKTLSSTASSEEELGEKDILIVSDSPTNFTLIDAVISSLDIQSPQINIAVKFIETTLKHNEIIGINWDLRKKMDLTNNGVSDTTLTFGEMFLGGQTMNFATLSSPIVSTILNLLANDKDTKLLQEPQVTTTSNSSANIIVGTTIPILVPQGEGSVFGSNPYTYENQNINVSLDVLPKVNKQKIISMKIDAVVQAIIGFVGKDERPMISTRSTNTNVRVKNGETLLIGGLIFDSDQEIESKVPILGDIPLIKKLFRSSDKDKEQRELLIFITPTVVTNKI